MILAHSGPSVQNRTGGLFAFKELIMSEHTEIWAQAQAEETSGQGLEEPFQDRRDPGGEVARERKARGGWRSRRSTATAPTPTCTGVRGG